MCPLDGGARGGKGSCFMVQQLRRLHSQNKRTGQTERREGLAFPQRSGDSWTNQPIAEVSDGLSLTLE
ncbi:hypothetical protein HMPREF1249_0426 [Jonquetella sp. BV3C21]|nr:hypothetical protein HMPREF1249_0426 [Jonquetella sp. BV3C21]